MELRRRHTVTLSAAVVTGLVGSVLVAVGGSLRARVARTPGVGALEAVAHAHGARTLGFTLDFTGLVVLTAAWLLLGRRIRGRRDGVATVGLAAAVWVLPFLVAPPLFSGDAWSYVAEGDLVAQDRSPYVYAPLDLTGPIVHAVDPMWADVAAPYGPLPMVWGGLVSSISGNPWFGLLGFRVLALAGLAALAYAVPRLARRTGHDPALATWLAVASPFTLVHGVAGAHLDLAVAALLALAVLVALRGRWVWGAVLVGLAASVKATALVGVVPVVLAWAAHSGPDPVPLPRRVRHSVDVTAVSVATLLGLGLVSGLGTGWLTGLRTPLGHNSPLSPTTEVALHLQALTGLDLRVPMHALGVAVLGLLLVRVLLRHPAGSPADVVRAACAVTVATVALSPVVHYWYAFWCLPFLACAVLPRRVRRVVVTGVLVLGLLAPVDYSAGHVPSPGRWIVLGLLVVVAAALGPADVRRAVRFHTGSKPHNRAS